MAQKKIKISVNRQKIVDCAFIFFICFIPRLCQSIEVIPLNFRSDETSALYIAARLAGYDWNDVISNAGYYGIGFLWIFAPLFSMGLSSITIYRITASVLAGVNALTGPVFYCITDHFFNIESRVKKVTIASICGNLIFFYVATISTRNEEILALLVCIVTYLLCKIIKERKFRDELLLSFVMLYSLTCHTRAVAILMTVILVSIIYSVFYRKKLFHTVTYIINLAGYFLVSYLLNLYRLSIWGKGSVTNSSVTGSVGNALSNIFAKGNIMQILETWTRIVCGQVFTASMISGGLFLIAAISCAVYLFNFLKRRKEDSSETLFILSLTALILICFTIFTQGITWLSGVYDGIYLSGSYSYVYSYKAFTYMRYFGPYVPMLVMTAFCCWEKDNTGKGKYVLLKTGTVISVICFVILLFFWVNSILPFIYPEKPEYLYFLAGFKYGVNSRQDNWIKAFTIAWIICVVYLVAVLRDRVEIGLTVSLILLICEQVYIFNNLTLFKDQSNYEQADAGYDVIQNSPDIFGEDIYVYDTSDVTDHQIWYLYQFLNYRCHIIPEFPEDTSEDFILFTNGEVDLNGENIVGYKLDDNEYFYTNVPEYKGEIEAMLINGMGRIL